MLKSVTNLNKVSSSDDWDRMAFFLEQVDAPLPEMSSILSSSEELQLQQMITLHQSMMSYGVSSALLHCAQGQQLFSGTALEGIALESVQPELSAVLETLSTAIDTKMTQMSVAAIEGLKDLGVSIKTKIDAMIHAVTQAASSTWDKTKTYVISHPFKSAMIAVATAATAAATIYGCVKLYEGMKNAQDEAAFKRNKEQLDELFKTGKIQARKVKEDLHVNVDKDDKVISWTSEQIKDFLKVAGEFFRKVGVFVSYIQKLAVGAFKIAKSPYDNAAYYRYHADKAESKGNYQDASILRNAANKVTVNATYLYLVIAGTIFNICRLIIKKRKKAKSEPETVEINV